LVAGLFVMAMFISLRTLSLTGAQVADRDLGRFSASVGYGSIMLPPGEDRFVQDVRARTMRLGVTDAEVVLSIADMQLATTPSRAVSTLEAAWQYRPFPKRYELLSGRWPTRAGEVVVTEPQDVRAAAGDGLPVLGGKATLQVVGTADDRFARTTNLLVAPGTWASLDPSLAEGFQVLDAQPFLLWSGVRQDDVVAAYAAAVRDWKQRLGSAVDGGDPDMVGGTLQTREQLSARPERTWIERTPAGYTLPSLLLPLAATLLVFGANHRRFRRTLNTLVNVGVRPLTAVAALALAAIAWCLTAAAGGAVVGTVVGVGARAVIARLRDKAPGPIDGLDAPLLRLLAITVFATLCAAAALAMGTRKVKAPVSPRPEAKTTAAPKRRGRDARHLLAVAAWCAAVAYAIRVDSPAKAMILTGVLTFAVLLVIPDVLDVMLRVLPEGGPRRRLAHRQLAADRNRATAALAILTVLMGASLGYLALLDTLIRTADQRAYPEALPGQVLLADRASITFPPPATLLRAVDASGVANQLPRTELTFLFTTDADGNVTRSATRDGRDDNLLAVETAAQVEQLIGHSLNPTQRSALAEGGLLVWADAPDAPSHTVPTRLAIKAADTLVSRTHAVPAVAVEVPLVEWRIGTDGVLLRSTALGLNLPVPKAGPLVISNVSTTQADAIHDAVARAGLDAKMIRIYTPPPAPVPPAALVVTAAGLVILAVTAVLAATRAQTRALRGYLARLISIGIPATWARDVLLYQYGILVAASTLLSLGIALPPTAVVAMRISGFALSIPWAQLLTLLAAIYLAATIAALRCVLTLRAREGIDPAT
jgi:hypothetical protein